MSHSARLLLAFTVLTLPAAARADGEARPLGEILGPKLVVCADPANLPYSNKPLGGFENRIADVLAADLGVQADQFWFAGHKTFLRRTLLEGNCDTVLTLPQGLPGVVTTRPYFTSSFVAVTRADDSHEFKSFDDPWLGEARIGLQLVGNEGATTAPAFSLSARGFNEHITGFPMWAEEGAPEPQGRIVDAVAKGEIDIAFVWGPFGGFFAKPYGDKLRVTPILADPGKPEVAFVFPMAIGVRKTDADFRDRLQLALDRHQIEIAAILRDFGVPLVATPEEAHIAATPAQDSPRN